MLPDDTLTKTIKNPRGAYRYIQNNIRFLDEIGRFGVRGVPVWAATTYHRHQEPGADPTAIWERDWDLLIILDGCRLDWMEEVTEEHEFIDSVDDIWSVGGHSEEWLNNTFNEASTDWIEDTAYVTANHFSDKVSHNSFAVFDQLTDIDTPGSSYVTPAHIVTDRAISVARNNEFERMVVHYMQPHKPFFERTGDRQEVTIKEWSLGADLYHRHFLGELTQNDVWEGFVDNLRYVLDEVSLLLQNVDAP